MAIDKNKSTDNSKYDYSQSNPLGSENPCDLIKPRGTVKTRGITAYDLLKPTSKLKVKRTQKEIQECCRPSFDHPKILHILIDRAKGFGCKTLAKRHGGSNTQISKFCQSMGFDVIKPEDIKRKGPNLMKEAVKLMHYGLLCDQREVAKYDERKHWAGQKTKEYCAWMTSKRWHSDEEYRNKRLSANISDEERDRRKVYRKRYQADNRERLNAKAREWQKNNQEKVREYQKKGRKKPINKIRHNLRKRLRKYLKATGEMWGGFGCTSDQLREYIERQFTRKMNWENYGAYWHVDHIRPIASFDLFDQEQREAANHYTNLQPLEAKKNLAKSDDWDGQVTMLAELL